MFCGGSSPKKIVLHYTESKSPLWGSVFKKCSKNIIVLIVRTRNPDFLRFFRQIKKADTNNCKELTLQVARAG